MAKVTGPLMSIAASGSLAGAITFASRGKSFTAYAKRQPTGAQPDANLYKSAMWAWIASSWRGIGSTDQATWTEPAAAAELTPQQLYQKTNMLRWLAGGGWCATYVVPNTVYSYGIGLSGIVPFRHAAEYVWSYITDHSLTSPVLFLATPGTLTTMDVTKLRLVQVSVNMSGNKTIITGLTPGAWQFQLGRLNPFNQRVSWSAIKSATITG